MITFGIIVKLKTIIVKLSYLIHIVHNCAQLFHDMYCHENTMMFVVVITTTVVIFIITIGFNNAGEPTMSVACATYYRVWGADGLLHQMFSSSSPFIHLLTVLLTTSKTGY